MKWHTEQRKVSDLIPYENNPRTMTEKQVADLTASLKKFDLVEIPAINTDGLILAGHQRIKILAALGRFDEIIDVRVPDRTLTEAECREYNVRSNRNVGGWDFDILANCFDMSYLQEWGFEPWEFGVDAEINNAKTNEDKAESETITCPKCGHTFTEIS